MTTPNGWNTARSFQDWMRQTDKRVGASVRRPGATSAQALLGPGFGPTASEVLDWNQDEAVFSGQFWSDLGAINGPDPSVQWVGVVFSIDRSAGYQVVWEVSSAANPRQYMRKFTAPSGAGTTRLYGSWNLVVPNDTGLQENALAVTPSLSWTITEVTHRIINKTMHLRIAATWTGAAITAITDTLVCSISLPAMRPLFPVSGAYLAPAAAGGYQIGTDGSVALMTLPPGAQINTSDVVSIYAVYGLA